MSVKINIPHTKNVNNITEYAAFNFSHIFKGTTSYFDSYNIGINAPFVTKNSSGSYINSDTSWYQPTNPKNTIFVIGDVRSNIEPTENPMIRLAFAVSVLTPLPIEPYLLTLTLIINDTIVTQKSGNVSNNLKYVWDIGLNEVTSVGKNAKMSIMINTYSGFSPTPTNLIAIIPYSLTMLYQIVYSPK